MSAPDGPLPPLAPAAWGVPGVDHPGTDRYGPATAPPLSPAVGWWGFGLSFASAVPPMAGAALALSIVGIVQARSSARHLAPPVIGAVIASLALAAQMVVGVLFLAGALEAVVSSQDASLTAEEPAFLDALAIDSVGSDEAEPDDGLVVDGHDACTALTACDTSGAPLGDG